MFFRLLIYAILGFVVYRAVKSVVGGAGRQSNTGMNRSPDRVDDVMTKDPVCGTHFLKRDGVALTTSHDVLYFCSNECRDSYLAQQSKHS